ALLRDWAETGSEAAFAQIVRRYIGLVFHTCLRELQDRPLAEDASQAVFLVLAQKGHSMADRARLAGWLFRTSRLISRDLIKAEKRLRRRELAAAESALAERPEEHAERLASTAIVNDALAVLRETEREAVLLRFHGEMEFS
ncbi:MAG TPA: sigma-70 family RNA polymerase sigma factor, partial [Capsulimonadaceae bacterium]|nr:sigma-70 family RNA polymerase sigma factor [Capsulimonadaceae bacterium]